MISVEECAYRSDMSNCIRNENLFVLGNGADMIATDHILGGEKLNIARTLLRNTQVYAQYLRMRSINIAHGRDRGIRNRFQRSYIEEHCC